MTTTPTERPNYRYWQQHGGEWVDIYAERKRRLAYYDLQELLIVEHVVRTGATTVLEVGMGVGRHLRNLRAVCDVHGYDQSPEMFEAVRSWAEPDWFERHVRLGAPVGRLPYDDDAFDLVFTSEVLVHVHPDDLPTTLAELRRVARRQILHVEPSSPRFIEGDDHDGCWWHDLPAAYGRLGLECVAEEPWYECQRPFLISLDPAHPVVGAPAGLAAVARQLERDLQPSIDDRVDGATHAAMIADRDRLWEEVTHLARRSAELESAATRLEADRDRIWQEVVAGRDRITELEDEARRLIDQIDALRLISEEQRAEVELGRAARQRVAVVEEALRAALEERERLALLGRPWIGARARLRRLPGASGAARLARAARGFRRTTSERHHGAVAGGEVALEPLAGAHGAETWVLDVVGTSGEPRPLPAPPPGWRAVSSDHSRSGTALVAEAGAPALIVTAGDADTIRLLRHPWSGRVRLRSAATEVDLELHAAEASVVAVRPDGRPSPANLAELSGVVTDASGAAEVLPLDAWLARVAAGSPAAIGVTHPRWRGIRSSMQNLFSYTLLLQDEVTDELAELLVDALTEAGVEQFVTGGFPHSYGRLVEHGHQRGLRAYGTWHGSFLQYNEPYGRAALLELLAAARSGAIERVGFLKSGMAETYARLGVPATTLLNYVRVTPEPAGSRPATDRLDVGIWSVEPVWRKLPYAMLAACSDLGSALGARVTVHASGRDQALVDLAAGLGIELRLLGSSVPQEHMPRWLRAMDLNLYVTLSECAPMLPLESLAVGVPCLLGPNTHYFDHDHLLHDSLVVTEPDRHERIAAKAAIAVARRAEIVEHYRTRFAPDHRARAEAAARALVGSGPEATL